MDENKKSTILKTPTLVKIIGIVLLIVIFSNLIGIIQALKLDFLKESAPTNVVGSTNFILFIITTIGLGICSIGLLKMKKWGLWGTIIVLIFQSIVTYFLSSIGSSGYIDPVVSVIKIAIIAYLLSIFKKFT